LVLVLISGYDRSMKLWRRRRSKGPKATRNPSDGRQVWLRTPNALDAVTGQFPSAEPAAGNDRGEIYADEIDPAWRDPETAE
jgi:hypothetical protein